MDTSYHKLICSVANKFYKRNPAYDVEDLVQECYLALPRIISAYQDEMKISLISYISVCLERRLIDIFRYYKRRPATHLSDKYDIPHNYNHEINPDINDLINTLNDSQKKLVKDLYWENKTFRNIASEQKRNRCAIHRQYNKIIQKLRVLAGE